MVCFLNIYDYIFVNINLQLHYIIYILILLDITWIIIQIQEFTFYPLFFFCSSLQNKMVFESYIHYYFLCNWQFYFKSWLNNDYKKFRKIYLMGGLSITILAAVFSLFIYTMDKKIIPIFI